MPSRHVRAHTYIKYNEHENQDMLKIINKNIYILKLELEIVTKLYELISISLNHG